MKVYLGTVEDRDWRVHVKDLITGEVTPLTHHVKHSPDGFAWGYSGSGPTELARCLLIDALGDPDPDPSLVLRYRAEVISRLDQDRGFTIGRNSILSWVRNRSEALE